MPKTLETPKTLGPHPAIIAERLAAVTHYDHGSHNGPDGGMCIMEGEAWIAGEPWSDTPACVSPVIGAFCRSWNDSLNDADRDRLLLPFKGRLIGTASTPEIEEKRSLMAVDWLVRTHTPVWLRLAGLTAQAERLEALPEITSMAQVPLIRGLIEAAYDDAVAVGAAAGDTAAWEVARETTRDTAGGAAVSAAGIAAWDPAWRAVLAAAGIAAGIAGKANIRPTVDHLQASAAALIERMIAA